MNKAMRAFGLLILCWLQVGNSYAGPFQAEAFKQGSYQQLLKAHEGESFVLVVWSLTCSSCLKEMETLREIHAENKTINLVMLSVDDYAESEEIGAVLAGNSMSDVESWIFTESNSQRLRYEIDPAWYGELPRTYFFSSDHQRKGVSGKLSKEKFLSLMW
ncbi:MAG: TlpA family protein disulfide reductase [Gammaproteobacteria bacterium]